MAAPKKYDRTFALELAIRAADYFAHNPLAYLVNSFLIQEGLRRQRWAEIRKEYKDDEEVARHFEMVDLILEDRLVSLGFARGQSIAMVIMVLANHYGWKRKDAGDDGPDKSQARVIFTLPDNGKRPT